LHLAALRLLTAGEDQQKSLVLQRYVLGLALTAFTSTPAGYLRQGCNLVANPEKRREFRVVFNDGRAEASGITHDEAVSYAQLAAEAFGVGEDREVPFEVQRAKAELGEATEKKQKAKAKK
jgi:CRISPR-associated protein Csb1